MLECAGTETGFSHTHPDARHRYADYREMYTNCTHVRNNLEIVYLDDDDDYDLGFLSNIREVCTTTERYAVLGRK